MCIDHGINQCQHIDYAEETSKNMERMDELCYRVNQVYDLHEKIGVVEHAQGRGKSQD